MAGSGVAPLLERNEFLTEGDRRSGDEVRPVEERGEAS